ELVRAEAAPCDLRDARALERRGHLGRDRLQELGSRERDAEVERPVARPHAGRLAAALHVRTLAAREPTGVVDLAQDPLERGDVDVERETVAHTLSDPHPDMCASSRALASRPRRSSGRRRAKAASPAVTDRAASVHVPSESTSACVRRASSELGAPVRASLARSARSSRIAAARPSRRACSSQRCASPHSCRPTAQMIAEVVAKVRVRTDTAAETASSGSNVRRSAAYASWSSASARARAGPSGTQREKRAKNACTYPST